MNPAHLLILGVGAVASVVVFLLLRRPELRRQQFRHGRRFTLLQSALGATATMAVFVLFALLQP